MKNKDSQANKPKLPSGSHELSPRCGGPRTPQGKQRAKYNRLGHTIFARAVLKEEEAHYRHLLVSFRKAKQPVGGLEEFLVQKLAFVALRSCRVYKADLNVAPLLFSAIGKTLAEGHSPMIAELVNRNHEVVVIRKEPSPELLLRYETGLERHFDRILTQLERLQRTRLDQAVPPPVKVEVST